MSEQAVNDKFLPVCAEAETANRSVKGFYQLSVAPFETFAQAGVRPRGAKERGPSGRSSGFS